MKSRFNLKWQTIVYFFLSTVVLLVVGLFVFGWLYKETALGPTQIVIAVCIIILLVSLVFGYMTAQNTQRKFDTLHLAILQLAKGNLSNRIHTDETGSFARICQDFNDMADTIEHRIKLLQKLGEEHVMQQAESTEAAVLEERRRLARDLHDTVSQQLFALHMSASSLPKLLDSHPETAKQVLDQLISMSHHAQRQMRGLIAQLRPLELDGKSLADALDKWFPDYCRQNGLQGSMDIQLREPMNEAKEHQMFLIVQEAMANVVKHASASHVSLSLYDHEHQYVLTITDDGKGFVRSSVQTGSYGLSTMKERAQKLGGDAEILSRPGSGTRIKVTIPKFLEH